MSTALAILAFVFIVATFWSMSPMTKPNGWRTAVLALAAAACIVAAGATAAP